MFDLLKEHYDILSIGFIHLMFLLFSGSLLLVMGESERRNGLKPDRRSKIRKVIEGALVRLIINILDLVLHELIWLCKYIDRNPTTGTANLDRITAREHPLYDRDMDEMP